MLRAGLIAALVAGGLAGCGGGANGDGSDGARTDDGTRTPTRSGTAPFGVVTRYDRDYASSTSSVSRLDAVTLRPRGPRGDVSEYHDTGSFSPDGRHVALGTGGQQGDIQIYAVSSMKRTRSINLGVAVEAIAWLKPRRIVVMLQSSRWAVVDPRTGATVHRQSLSAGERVCSAGARSSAVTTRGLAVLLHAESPRPARLIIVDAEGTVREVSLPAGSAWGCGRAGLAVTPSPERAFVVSGERAVAEVDLASMKVEHHEVSGELPAKAHSRDATWLDGSLVTFDRESPGAGVTVIDTATWTARRLSASGGAARVADGVILTFDGSSRAARRNSEGLSGYEPGGRRLFRVLRGKHVSIVHLDGQRAYAQTPRRLYAVDVPAGKIAGSSRAIRTDISLVDGSH